MSDRQCIFGRPDGPPRRFKRSDEWRNFFASWPEDDDGRLAGLPPRHD